MAQAVFVHGTPQMIDYTPSGADVAAGDMIVAGESVYIAHKDIADGELGSVAAGGGVYDIVADTGAAGAFTFGEFVYWDAADMEAQDDADTGTNKRIGTATADAAQAETLVRVYHVPN